MKNTNSEMENILDRIDRWDTAEQNINKPEDISIETFQMKQRLTPPPKN